jgi:hypothetical protein
VADAEAERLDRPVGVAQDADPLGERLPRRVALRGGDEAPHGAVGVVRQGQARELDQRVPGARVTRELLAERPDGEVGRPLLLVLVLRGAQRVAVDRALRGTAPHDLGEGLEGPDVVRVVAQHGAQGVLVERVAPARGRRRTAHADLGGRRRTSHELA